MEDSFDGLTKEERKKRIKKSIIYFVVVLVVFGFGFWLYVFIDNYDNTKLGEGIIHWHADVEIIICGKKTDLPKADPNNVIHGEAYLGTPLLHTHSDNRVHIEGFVKNESEITLGKFLDNIGLVVVEDGAAPCEGKEESKWTVSINKVENSNFRDYSIKNGDKIRFVYE